MTPTTLIRPGDWIGTIGRAGWRFWLAPLYAGIKEYSRRKYPMTPHRQNPIWDVTHIRIPLGDGRLFEMTVPAGRIIPFETAELDEKFAAGLVRVARWPDVAIDEAKLNRIAEYYDGEQYDYGDLADFGLSGLLGVYNHVFRIFGDKAGRFAVCSTAAARIMEFAGVTFPVSLDSVDPNWPFNQPPGSGPVDITNQLTPESFRKEA